MSPASTLPIREAGGAPWRSIVGVLRGAQKEMNVVPHLQARMPTNYTRDARSSVMRRTGQPSVRSPVNKDGGASNGRSHAGDAVDASAGRE